MALDYTLTYAGVPFFGDDPPSIQLPLDRKNSHSVPGEDLFGEQQPLPALTEEIERVISTHYTQEFTTRPDFLGRNLGALAVHNPKTMEPSHRIHLFDYYYPNTASRWSVFRGLATSSQAKAMLLASQGDTPQPFVMRSNPIAPNHSDSAVSPYTVSTNLYLLSCRPLGEHGAGFDGLYLITLVDERYYFSRTTLHLHQLATWASLISTLGAALGITITYSALPAVYTYAEPDSQLWANAEPASALLDAVAYNVGRTVVRNLDGTYNLQSPSEAAAAVQTNRGSPATVTRLAGGDLFYSGGQLPIGNLFNAKNAVVPKQVSVTFPKYVVGNDPVQHYLNTRYAPQRAGVWYEESYGEVHTVTIPIASGGVYASGVSGTSTLTLHSTAKAMLSGEVQGVSGTDPMNAADLAALAGQMAQDFYGWKLAAALDEVYPGIYNWSPEGIHDVIWTYSEKRRLAATRVLPAPWNQVVREFQHSAPPLSGYTNVPKGVGGPSVAQTWRDSLTNPAQTSLANPMASGDLTALFNVVTGFPTNKNWRGTISSGGPDEEVVLFRGTAGNNAVAVVYRGIDGSVQQSHNAGATVLQNLPDTVYGVNLVTAGSGLKVSQGAWTSGGISEAILTVDLTVPQTGDVTINGTLTVNGPTDFEGAIISTPLPNPLITGITTTNTTPPTTTFTFVIAGEITPNSLPTTLSPPVSVNTNTTAGDIFVSFTPVNGITTYNIYTSTPNNGLIATVTVNPTNNTVTAVDTNNNTLLTTSFVSPQTTLYNVTFTPATPPPTTNSPANTVVGTLTTTDPNPNQTYTYTVTTNSNLFTITNGQLVLTNPITTPGTYTVGIQVTDTIGITTTQNFTVTVYNPNLTTTTFVPSKPPPTTVTRPGTVVGTIVTNDPGQTFTYTVTSNSNLFTVTPAGQLVLTNPITTPGPITVGIQVTDTLGTTFTQNITVTAYNPITALTFTPTYPPATTNSPANTLVGTLTTTDPNANSEPLTYAITSPNNNLFTVDSSGNVTLQEPIAKADTYTVTAQVTDALGLQLAITFEVIVTNPSDTPPKPLPASIATGGGPNPPVYTVDIPVTSPVDVTKPTPTVGLTGMVITVATNNNVFTVPIQPPTATIDAPLTGSSTASIQVTVITPLGESLPSATATIANAPATFDAKNVLNVTITPPVNIPSWKQGCLQYGVYLTGGTVTNAQGLLMIVGPFQNGSSNTVTYTGTAPLPAMQKNPPSTNTTALSTIPGLTSTSVLPLGTPAAPTVITNTTGSTTYSYVVVAKDNLGSTAASPAATVTTGSSPQNNTILWPSVPGALSYAVYRTAGGSSQGLIGTVYNGKPLFVNDTGLAGDGSTAPNNNTTGSLFIQQAGASGVYVGQSGFLQSGMTASGGIGGTYNIASGIVQGFHFISGFAYSIGGQQMSGTQTVVTNVSCSGGVLAVTTANWRFVGGLLQDMSG